MGEFFKNLFITAFIVVAATAGASAVSFVAALFLGTPAGEWPELSALVGVVVIAGLMAILFGVVFSVVTLPVAAITVPLVLLPARAMHLPRPAVDMIGGGLAAWFSVGLAIDFLNQGQLRGYGLEPNGLVMTLVGIAAGAFAGYVRWALLGRGVRPRLIPTV
jgi:hypothetical protein